MRDYGKVHTKFWTSEDIQCLGDDAKILALYLLSGPHTTQIGCFRLPDGYVAEDLKWGLERVSKGFAELNEKGFATRDDISKWVVVHKFLKWNEIENPNQAKAAGKLFDAVPDVSPVKRVLARCLREFSPKFSTDHLDRFEGVSKGLPEGFRNQEQEQEQKQEHNNNPDGLFVASHADDQSSQRPKLTKPQCPHQEIIALYHELLPANPSIRDWTPARAEHLRVRWNEDPKRQTLDWWRRFFAYIGESAFLTGRATAKDRKPFAPGLDWIVKAENFAKIREGRFHDQEAA